mgnify:CR=1 FL=1
MPTRHTHTQMGPTAYTRCDESRHLPRVHRHTEHTHTIMTNDKNELEENEDESEDLEVK